MRLLFFLMILSGLLTEATAEACPAVVALSTRRSCTR